MKTRTLLVLAALVGVLGLLYLREQKAKDESGEHAVQSPLFVGFQRANARAIRIDNLERAVQVTLERDAYGAWFLTDPEAYPATESVVNKLFDDLAQGQGEVAHGVDPADVGLAPPKIVLEVDQVTEEGERTYRLEIGAVDVDPRKLYVRVPDHPAFAETRRSAAAGLFRATRSLYNTLDRNPHDYRSRRTTPFRGQDITSFRRSGRVMVPETGEVVDLTLDALVQPDGWRKMNPPRVALEPQAIGLLARGAAELRVAHFTADLPSSFDPWGLDVATFEIELTDERGESVRLLFGRPPLQGPGVDAGERWYVRRAGFPHVWEVEPGDVRLLLLPASDLFDSRLVRARRDQIASLRLEGNGGALVLARGEDGWEVHRENAPKEVFPADPRRVEEALARLENAEVGAYAEGLPFVPSDPGRSISIRTESARFGGRLGGPWRDPATAAEGLLFLRDGDEIAGLVDESVDGLCDWTLDDFRSPRVHSIDEARLRGITLTRSGHELGFLLVSEDRQTRWLTKNGRGKPARAFLDSLDRLLHLRALEWLPEAVSLDEAIDVVVLGNQGSWSFQLGRDAQGRTVCVEDGRSSVVDASVGDEELLDLLGSLFAG